MSDDLLCQRVGDPTRGHYVSTHSGTKFYPMDPRPEDIHLEDIAYGLSNTVRFGGQTDRFLSVAEHSILVAYKVIEGGIHDYNVVLWALLHDAAEAYIGDMPRPLKRMIPEFETIERGIITAIARRFDLSPAMPDIVKAIDRDICAAEAKQAWFHPPEWVDQFPAMEIPALRFKDPNDILADYFSFVTLAIAERAK